MGEHSCLTALYECNVYDIILIVLHLYVMFIFIFCYVDAIFYPTTLIKICFLLLSIYAMLFFFSVVRILS